MIDLPPMAPRTSILTDRPITHEEARGCAQRLINSLFQNPNGATVSIPADRDNDDDLVLMAYIAQQQSRQPEIDHFKFNLERVQQHLQHTIAERDALRAALDESVKLQSHYADLLNMYDGGQRIIFKSTEEWLERLTALESKGNPNAPKT